MRPRSLALLAAVVAALAAFVLLYERELPSTEERRALDKKVFRVEADAIRALTIEWQGTEVRLEREPAAATDDEDAPAAPARWRLLAPYVGAADRTLADRLCADLAGLEIGRRLADAERAAVGLAPPRGRIRWTAADGEGVLELGGDVPASSNVVVATGEGSTPLVVARTIVADVERPAGDWRAKEVLDAEREAIERVRLVPRGGEEVVLARRGEGFLVERPFADLADRDLVDALLGELTGLRAETFLDAPLDAAAEAALTGGPGRLELALAGRSAPFVLEVGGPTGSEGTVALRADGQAITARARLAEALARPAAAWRSPSWTSFDSWRTERMRVEDAAGKLELVRRDGDWQRDGRKLSYAEVGDLLYALTAARAERVVTAAAAAAYPAAGPELTVVLADAAGAEETLTLYAPRAGEALVPARAAGRDVVLLLPPAAADEVRAKLAAVRAAKPLDEPAADAETAPAAVPGTAAASEAAAASDAAAEPPPAP